MNENIKSIFYLFILLCFVPERSCQATTAVNSKPTVTAISQPTISTTSQPILSTLDLPLAIINISFPTIQNPNPLSTNQPSSKFHSGNIGSNSQNNGVAQNQKQQQQPSQSSGFSNNQIIPNTDENINEKSQPTAQNLRNENTKSSSEAATNKLNPVINQSSNFNQTTQALSQPQSTKSLSTQMSNLKKTPTDSTTQLPKENAMITQKIIPPRTKQNQTDFVAQQNFLTPPNQTPAFLTNNQQDKSKQQFLGNQGYAIKQQPNISITSPPTTPLQNQTTQPNQNTAYQHFPQTQQSQHQTTQPERNTTKQLSPQTQQPLFNTRNKTSTVSVTSRNKNTKQPPTVAFTSTSNQPDLQTNGDIECYKASDGTVKCRSKMPQAHVSTSQFKGDVGIKASGLNGTKILGGETTNKLNETMNFKAGRSNYDFQNLTSFHNCSGCLENKELIKINTSSPIKTNKTKSSANHQPKPSKITNTTLANYPEKMNMAKNATNTKFIRPNAINRPKNQTEANKSSQTEMELSEISKLRKKLLSSSANRTNFMTNNISRPASSNKTLTNAPLLNPKTSHLNLNTTTRERIEPQTPLQRKCEEIDAKRNTIGNSTGKLNIGVILSCVTKRRLVATNHKTKTTKKNGKIVDEAGKKPSNNTERAQQNEENNKSNEERKHQSEENIDANNKQSLSNEKILQQILKGEHGNPVTSYAHEDKDRNFENQTIKLDPSIIHGRMPMDGKIVDPDHLDEDNAVMGINENPAIETKMNETKTNKTTSKDPPNNDNIKGASATNENQEHEIKPKLGEHHLHHNTSSNNRNKTKTDPQIGINNTKSNSQIGKNITKSDSQIGKNITKMESNLLPANRTDVGSALTTVKNSDVLDKKNTTKIKDEDETEIEKPKKRILAFGDSLTKGTYSKNTKVHPYSKHLLELLNQNQNTTYEIFTEGVNGECACQGMVHRLPDELEYRKNIDLVIIIAGTNDLLKNDCLRECDLFEAIKRLHEIAHRKKAKSVLTTILESTFTPAKLSSQEYRDVLSDVNQKIRGYANYRDVKDKVTLCDIADELPRKAPPLIDKIHPSPEGYDKLAEILYECIKDFQY